MQVQQSTTTNTKWVSESEYARIHGLSRQTLTNWRWRDAKEGRKEALPGFPEYRRFGRAVRYRIETQG
jgi:hypothetical protein